MSILKKLKDKDVVGFDLNETKDKLNVFECCDYYFETELTKSESLKLIDELKKLVNKMIE